MQLYSTNDRALRVGLKEAVFQGMPADNGLYMPERIPTLPASFFERLPGLSMTEHATEVAATLLDGAIPCDELRGIIERALPFGAPLVPLQERTYVLELFHGPSLAFKDFGARFMAELMSYFLRDDHDDLLILVATSGDTGGAVAAGFHRVPGIRVVVLYPSGQVSLLQERQFTSLGDNITAVEINGTFDDCQALVKSAFLDDKIRSVIRLSTANSINIARLIPQVFYYFEAYRQLPQPTPPPVFAVPSGNFGNLTAGLIAQRMGLPVEKFLAVTNINDVVPEYLERGIFAPRPSQPTLSSAMDVGNPSNFARILDLFGSTWNIVREHITGFRFTDAETADAIQEVEAATDYLLDPHGAVAYLGWKAYRQQTMAPGILLETAHPAKFEESVEDITGHRIDIPERLAVLRYRAKHAIPLDPVFSEFKTWLLRSFAD
jgi:threonine synthase